MKKPGVKAVGDKGETESIVHPRNSGGDFKGYPFIRGGLATTLAPCLPETDLRIHKSSPYMAQRVNARETL